MAISIEKCNLHRRFALNSMRVIGTSPRLLMLGFMIPTAFLSMWISNNATTSMMIPIMEAVLVEMELIDQGTEQRNLIKKLRFDMKLLEIINFKAP